MVGWCQGQYNFCIYREDAHVQNKWRNKTEGQLANSGFPEKGQRYRLQRVLGLAKYCMLLFM